ncbi:hypothetical protein [Sphingobium estronivorans]|uniref:hypothetical protein n=1 Tax=Sphingobium estronivorans TaxID=1577690 RepID=UPI001238E7AB|nr:hypothetical protein [Sphingobium estronivorans]
MSPMHLVLHGLAIKKHAGPDEIAGLIGLSATDTAEYLRVATSGGRAIEANGKYLLSPLARVALESDYFRHYAELRDDADFFAAYEAFERINVQLKALITDWQTMEVAGQRVANDHSNGAHDEKVIGRLGDLHERADSILSRLTKGLPRLNYYRIHLLSALEKAEDGAIEWVSDARIESYHTLWFELHEDLLRIVGRTRVE